MVHGLHPRMMEKFRDLALFRCASVARLFSVSDRPHRRRAIKTCEKFAPENLSAFTKLVGEFFQPLNHIQTCMDA